MRRRGERPPAGKLALCQIFAVDGGKEPPARGITQLARLHNADAFRVPQKVRIGESTAVIPSVRARICGHFGFLMKWRCSNSPKYTPRKSPAQQFFVALSSLV